MPLSDADKIINLEDLAAFKAKMDESVFHKTGDETIEGVKTFQNTAEGHATGETVTDLIIRNPEVERGTLMEGGRSYTRVIFADAEGDTEETFAGRLGLLEVVSPQEDDTIGEELRLGCYRYSDVPADCRRDASLKVGYDLDGIPFSTAPATSADRTESTDIVTRGYMEASEWNWQKMEKAGAVTFKPVPESDLEPVVDFMFTEIPPAEGEKGPENPSTITGVTQVKVTRCGKNLLHLLSPSDSTIIENVSFTVNQDGSVLVNGTATADASLTLFGASDVDKRIYYHNKSFTLHGCPSDGGNNKYYIGVQYRNAKGAIVGSSYDKGSGVTFNATYGDYVSYCGITIKSGYTADNLLFKPQLEFGTVATDFEPYEGNDYTIQLGDTYYGGSLDVATGVMTVTHAVRQFTGAENLHWNRFEKTNCTEFYAGSTVVLYPGKMPGITTFGVCSHFNKLTSTTGDVVGFGFYSSGFGGYFFYPGNITVDDWNAYLAEQYANGTPVTVVYPLAESFTVQLTPAQIRSLPALDKYKPRINTVYTDQEAVQVGYQRYAGGAVKALGTTTARTLPERFADVVNVKDFGAKGDGTTDDTAAIQAADAYAASIGASVFFPSGTYPASGLTMSTGWNMVPEAKILYNSDDRTVACIESVVAGVSSGDVYIDAGGREASKVVNITSSGSRFAKISVENLASTTDLSRAIYIYGSDNIFEDIYIKDLFASEGYNSNDSSPQGVCLSGSASNNYIHSLFSDNCRSPVVNNGVGTLNHFGSIHAINCKDNGYYGVNNASIVIDSLYYSGEDTAASFRQGDARVGTIWIEQCGSRAIAIGNVNTVYIDHIHEENQGTYLISSYYPMNFNYVANDVSIGRITGKVSRMFYAPSATSDSSCIIKRLSIDSVDIEISRDYSEDTDTTISDYGLFNTGGVEEFHIGSMKLRYYITDQVGESRTYRAWLEISSSLIRPSHIGFVDVSFFDARLSGKQERAGTSSLYIRNGAQENLSVRNGNVGRGSNAGHIYYNKSSNLREFLYSVNVPDGGTFRTGQVLFNSNSNSTNVLYFCVSGGTPGTWATVAAS